MNAATVFALVDSLLTKDFDTLRFELLRTLRGSATKGCMGRVKYLALLASWSISRKQVLVRVIHSSRRGHLGGSHPASFWRHLTPE